MKRSHSSIWGSGDKTTLQVLKNIKMNGTWLNLAAGDGRYVSNMLEKVDKLVVSDMDNKELEKLSDKLSECEKSKIEIRIIDIRKKLPFKENSFDGIFCTGTIHLFTKDAIIRIFKEIDRILKPKGKFVFDFATDIKRTGIDGRNIQLEDSNIYRIAESETFFKDLLKNYNIKLYKSKFVDDLRKEPKYGFITKGSFLLIVAEKK